MRHDALMMFMADPECAADFLSRFGANQDLRLNLIRPPDPCAALGDGAAEYHSTLWECRHEGLHDRALRLV